MSANNVCYSSFGRFSTFARNMIFDLFALNNDGLDNPPRQNLIYSYD